MGTVELRLVLKVYVCGSFVTLHKHHVKKYLNTHFYLQIYHSDRSWKVHIWIGITSFLYFCSFTQIKVVGISAIAIRFSQTFIYLDKGMRMLYIHKSYTKELLSAMTTSKLIIHFILKFALQLFWPYDKQPQTLVKSTFIFEDGQIGFASMKMTREIWMDNLHFTLK